MTTEYQYILIIFMRCTNDTQRDIANRVATITEKDPYWNDNVKTANDWFKADSAGVEGWYAYPQARESFTQVINAFNDSATYPEDHAIFAALRADRLNSDGEVNVKGLTDAEIAELRTFCSIVVADLSLGGDGIEQAVTDHIASYGYIRVFADDTP